MQKQKAQKKFFIQTFGCAMNVADSQRFRTILNNYGLKETKTRKTADIIIFNSCSVRQKAEDRIYGLKPEIKKLKENNPNLITVLTGCMVRRRIKKEPKKDTKTIKTKKGRAKEIKKRADWLDIIIETAEFQSINKLLENLEKEKNRPLINTSKTKTSDFLKFKRQPTKNNITAGITISHGCDHLCTFCIVPYARGEETNRNFNSILNETKKAIKEGSKDILLLGQTVNRWINPKFIEKYKDPKTKKLPKFPKINQILLTNKELETNEPKDFLQLLQRIDNLSGDFWLTFISSHPNYFTKELIDYIASSVKEKKHIRPFIHLALQSGNNRILNKMMRNHTIEEFIEKVQYMKKTIPNVAITTDIIVGFPTETEREFEDTIKVCELLEFDQIYISEYSAREGTAASFLKDDISQKTKAKRKQILNQVLEKTALKNNKKLLDTKQKVLIFKKINKDKYQGRTIQNKLIQVISSKDLKTNSFVNVTVTKATAWALEGDYYT